MGSFSFRSDGERSERKQLQERKDFGQCLDAAHESSLDQLHMPTDQQDHQGGSANRAPGKEVVHLEDRPEGHPKGDQEGPAFLFVAGLEGTGHHAMTSVLNACEQQGYCTKDTALSKVVADTILIQRHWTAKNRLSLVSELARCRDATMSNQSVRVVGL